jgi:hypothetical protein
LNKRISPNVHGHFELFLGSYLKITLVEGLDDGDQKDAPRNRCVDVVGDLPRCMDMIGAREVIQRIEMYFAGGSVRYLTGSEFDTAQSFLNCAANGVAQSDKKTEVAV